MNNFKKFYKKNYLYFLSFFLVSFIFLLVLMLHNIRPFGNNILLISDGEAQLFPFFVKYKNALVNNEIMINWNGGFAAPYYRLFLNHLSSPINLIALLFQNKNMDIAITVIIYIKLVLTSFSMIFYLKKKFNTNKLLLIIPSLLYAFSGYFLSYYFYVQWFDALYVLPILTYGIERLIDKHKIGVFILTLVYCIVCSVYISYMLCIYVIIYFIVYNFIYVRGKNIKDKINNISRNFLIILGSSILCMLIALPILYLYYYMSSTIGNIGGGFPNHRVFDFSYFDLFASATIGKERNIIGTTNTPPLIYSGILSLLMIIPFIFNRRIQIKDRLFMICMIVIIIMLFRIPILDFILNAFHIPNGVPYRYSFIYSFIVLVLLTNQLLKSNNNRKIVLLSCFVVSILIVSLIIKKIMIVKTLFLVISLLFTIIYTVSLFLKKRDVILLGLITIELLISLYIGFSGSIEYRFNNYDYNFDNNYIVQTNSVFYNQSYINDYSSYTTFNSTVYGETSEFLRKIGVQSFPNLNKMVLNTYVFNTLFNNKYFDEDLYGNNDFEINSDGIYEYKYPLAKVYGVKKLIDSSDFDDDFINNQNYIVESFTGESEVLTLVDVQGKILYEDDKIIVYKYLFDDYTSFYYSDSVFFVLADGRLFSISKPDKKYLQGLYVNTKENVYMKHLISNNNSMVIAYYKDKMKLENIHKFYKVDKTKFKNAYSYLSNRQLIIDNIDTYGIKGYIDAKEDMNMFSVIPYDDGWHVYVDGEEVEKVKVLDAFIGFKIKKGYHNIDIKYEIPKLKETLIVSFSTIIVIIIYNVFKKVKKHGRYKSI